MQQDDPTSPSKAVFASSEPFHFSVLLSFAELRRKTQVCCVHITRRDATQSELVVTKFCLHIERS